MEATRVPTGVPGLDQMIEGGFEKNANIILSGTPGTGKTTLAMQYLYNGVHQYGEPGLYLSTEETPEQITNHVKKLGWEIDKYTGQGKLQFSTFSYEDGMGKVEAATTNQVIAGLKYAFDNPIGFKRLVLDSVSMMSYAYENQVNKRIDLAKIFKWCKKQGVTSLFTMERNKWDWDFKFEDFLGDGVIVMHDMQVQSKSHRVFRVIKMRGTNCNRDPKNYQIGNNGITVYSDQEFIF